MKINSKFWIIGYLILAIAALCIIAGTVMHIDPFFHYHYPLTDEYFYPLNNQRSQNDGIITHFEYSGIITGTSMTENFKASEAEDLFGVPFIKVPYSGASFKEINESLAKALSVNNGISIIIRGLDMGKILNDKDTMREDLGEFPTYLYDANPFNDVKYVFNRDVIFSRVYPLSIARHEEGFSPGITSFDSYSNWMEKYTFGVNSVYPDGVPDADPGKPVYMNSAVRNTVLDNIHQNVTALAAQYPEVTFYYFITPYSAAHWMELLMNGTLYRYVEAEQLAMEEILACPNIKLFAFSDLTDITTDLNNYKDTTHYGEWINSLILKFMRDDQHLITLDNYQEYIDAEFSFYTTYDYSLLKDQIDYEDDFLAAELVESLY